MAVAPTSVATPALVLPNKGLIPLQATKEGTR